MTDEEIDALSVGSVIRYGKRGTLRIVRAVNMSHTTPGKVATIECAKRRCSSYPSPFAYVDRHFLKHHCAVTGARLRLDSAADRALAREVDHKGPGYEHKLQQCEAVEFPA